MNPLLGLKSMVIGSRVGSDRFFKSKHVESKVAPPREVHHELASRARSVCNLQGLQSLALRRVAVCTAKLSEVLELPNRAL